MLITVRTQSTKTIKQNPTRKWDGYTRIHTLHLRVIQASGQKN